MRGNVMYVIAMKENEKDGAYAVRDDDNEKVVFCFDERDDAERYLTLMEANDAPQKLEIMEIDPEVVAFNCDSYGYRFTVVEPEDFVIPPL